MLDEAGRDNVLELAAASNNLVWTEDHEMVLAVNPELRWFAEIHEMLVWGYRGPDSRTLEIESTIIGIHATNNWIRVLCVDILPPGLGWTFHATLGSVGGSSRRRTFGTTEEDLSRFVGHKHLRRLQ